MNTPIKLGAAYQDYIWGGTRLIKYYNKRSNTETLAESWELSVHPDGLSIVTSEKHTEQTFAEYLSNNHNIALGKNCKSTKCPILIKLIDAKDNLSVQVHPNDEYASRYENQNGKTEMWVILEAEENSSIYYGVNINFTKKEFKRRIETNTLLETLNKIPVNKGDIFFIEAGTIHSLGKGIMVYEIQQNSNVTYRLHDFNRKDAEGKCRDLHIDKSIDVSNLIPIILNTTPSKILQDNNEAKISLLRECPLFKTISYEISTRAELVVSTLSFIALTVIDGYGTITSNDFTMDIIKGDTIFFPASDNTYHLYGKLKALASSI